MPYDPYDPYAPANPWWQQQQRPQQGAQFGQPPPQQGPQQPQKQPSLLEMGLNIGRMTRPQYDKAVQGTGPAAMVSPWAWLGSLYGGGGPRGGR